MDSEQTSKSELEKNEVEKTNEDDDDEEEKKTSKTIKSPITTSSTSITGASNKLQTKKKCVFVLKKDELNICKYPKCKLKSIDNYDFCYQHIDLYNRTKTLCKWQEKVGDKKYNCDQAAFSLNGDCAEDDELKKYCLNHQTLMRIKKLRESGNCVINEDIIPKSSYKLIMDDVKDAQNSLLDEHKYELSEQKFLLENTANAEAKRINLKTMRKNLKSLKKSKSNASKKEKNDEKVNSSDERADDDEDDDEDDYDLIKNYFSFKNNVDMENDLDLLDSGDSLDQTMLNIIKSNGKQHGSDEEETNNKQIKFDYDEALKHSGIYTRDEVVKIFKCKLSKLQFLYKKQLAILNDRLIYDRKTYLVMKQSESNQKISPNTKQKKNLESLKLSRAAKKYQNISKKEQHMKQKYDPKNISSIHSIYKDDSQSTIGISSQIKCIFVLPNQNIRCGNLTLPSSKYCKDHILNDSSQILFCECSHQDDPNQIITKCKTPIIESIQPFCSMHLFDADGLLTKEEKEQISISKNKITLPPPPQIPSHLTQLATYYRNKKQKEDLKSQKQATTSSLNNFIQAASIAEEEEIIDQYFQNQNRTNGDEVNDVDYLTTFEQNINKISANNKLVRIKQEIIEKPINALDDESNSDIGVKCETLAPTEAMESSTLPRAQASPLSSSSYSSSKSKRSVKSKTSTSYSSSSTSSSVSSSSSSSVRSKHSNSDTESSSSSSSGTESDTTSSSSSSSSTTTTSETSSSTASSPHNSATEHEEEFIEKQPSPNKLEENSSVHVDEEQLAEAEEASCSEVQKK